MQLQKADDEALKQAAKLYKEKIAEEKRVANAAAKAERKRLKADKAAAKVAKIAENNTKRTISTSQEGKRKDSRSSQPKAKRVRAIRADEGCGRWCKVISAAQLEPAKAAVNVSHDVYLNNISCLLLS